MLTCAIPMTSCITLSILQRIATFLTKLQHKDAYVVSQLPTPMHRDVVLPSCLDCSRIHTRLLEADLWASEGHTRSVLHKDADNVRLSFFLFPLSVFPPPFSLIRVETDGQCSLTVLPSNTGERCTPSSVLCQRCALHFPIYADVCISGYS